MNTRSMFENFTDAGRRVVVLAEAEARALNADYVDTEHLLLGLIAEPDTIAAKVLENFGILLAAARAQVEETVGHRRGRPASTGELPFTPSAKNLFELARREALRLHHSYIGPEHLLLGIVRQDRGAAADVLVRLGADLMNVRQQVVALSVEQAETNADSSREQEADRLDAILASLREISGTLMKILRHLEDR